MCTVEGFVALELDCFHTSAVTVCVQSPEVILCLLQLIIIIIIIIITIMMMMIIIIIIPIINC